MENFSCPMAAPYVVSWSRVSPDNRVLFVSFRYGLDTGRFSLPSAVRQMPNGELLVSDGGACRLQRLATAYRRGSSGEGQGGIEYVRSAVY